MAEYSDEQRRRVNRIISEALKGGGARRHPAEVTSDRLGDAIAHWGDRLDGETKDMIGHVRFALQQIADEDREETT